MDPRVKEYVIARLERCIKASKSNRSLCEFLLFKKRELDENIIPFVIWTEQEVAHYSAIAITAEAALGLSNLALPKDLSFQV